MTEVFIEDDGKPRSFRAGKRWEKAEVDGRFQKET